MTDLESMFAENEPIAKLDEDQAWQLVASRHYGRLATTIGDDIEMFPVNFVVDDGAVVFRTAAGSKLFELTVNSRVAFEVDHVEGAGGWSVVLHGDARVLQEGDEIAHAETLDLRPWLPTIKTTFVRIEADRVSGRAFRFGEEPEGWHL